MLRITPLWRSACVGMHRVDHPDHDELPFERVADRYAVSFVERGAYLLEVDDQRWRVGAGDILLIHPGMHYRATGVDGRLNDVCLTLAYLGDDTDSFDPARTWARAQRPVLRATNRHRYLHWSLSHAVRAELPLLAESCAGELFREIREDGSPAANLYGAHKLAWYAERVHYAKEILGTEYSREHRLADLATSAGMSSFHFLRVFKQLVGVSPYRYLMDTRFKAAAAMLRERRSVTDTCFACGFTSLSHFSRLFSRRFGVNPSTYARHRTDW